MNKRLNLLRSSAEDGLSQLKGAKSVLHSLREEWNAKLDALERTTDEQIKLFSERVHALGQASEVQENEPPEEDKDNGGDV